MKEELKEYAKICSKEIVCEENHRKFIIHAGCSEFYKIKIDGDVEKNTKNKKCDFLIIKKDKEDIEIFIELKGKKIKDAYNQIIASYQKYSDSRKNPQLYAAIVTSKCPANDTSRQNVEILFNKENIMPFIKNKIIKTEYISTSNEIKKIN